MHFHNEKAMSMVKRIKQKYRYMTLSQTIHRMHVRIMTHGNLCIQNANADVFFWDDI